MIGFLKPVVAKSVTINLGKDTTRKITHPKEAMSDAEAGTVLKALQQKNNDKEKIAEFKSLLKGKGINMDQLIKLLNQFLTDDAKLESAQYAFAYTTNYKSFLRIMDLFQQEGYKYKLEDYYDKNRK
ncbi:DUF4476 domain-containing protein [Mucilaginibacter antarcticus]